ncbi:MAG: hypothetical protein ACOYNN_18485 [Terrimicrobiaceae bacterium]
MNITPIEGTVTYTYDELDRVYLRNVYKDDTVQRARNQGFGGNSQGLSIGGPQKPKELIYQDIHYYNTNTGDFSYIKRLYKPFMSVPKNMGGTITATVSSQSHIIAAGFHYQNSANETQFCFRVVQPFLLTQLNSYWHHTTNIPLLSAVTITKSAAGGSGFYKTFAIIETGTLFSKTLTIT